MKKLIKFFICFSFYQLSYSQSLEWVVPYTSTGQEWGNAINADASSNVYTIGSFSGTIDFDPGPGVFNIAHAGGNISPYISKLDSNGNFVWAKAFDGSGSGYGIDIDMFGNVYSAGRFSSLTDFDPGPGNYDLSNVFDEDIFVSKLDASGNFVWAKGIGGTGIDRATDIVVDDTGNVFVTGYFNGTVDFDPGAGTVNLTSSGLNEGFVVKLNSSGNFVWAKKIGGTGNDQAKSLALDDSNNVYITGEFTNTVDFDPGPSISNLTSAGITDIFILKLNQNGNFVWAKCIGAIGNEVVHCIEIDNNGGALGIAGTNSNPVDFDPGPMVANSTGPISIAKYDLNGNFIWVKALQPSGVSYPLGIDFDLASNVYTTGRWAGTGDMDPGPGIHNISTTQASVFVNRLDPNGNFVWGFVNQQQTGFSQGDDIAIDAQGNIYITGPYSGITDFDPDTGNYILDGINPTEAFVCRFSQDMCSGMTLIIDSIANGSCATPQAFASAMVLNGNPPYNYAWNTSPVITTPAANFSTGGIYNLTVTDTFNCSRSTSVFTNAPTYSTIDLNPNLVCDFFRPGFPTNMWLDGFNDGCTPISGQLKLILDSLVTLNTSNPVPDMISGDTLVWNFIDITFDSLHILSHLQLSTSATAVIGDSVHFKLLMVPLSGDADSTNNIKNYVFPIINGYDPNDKKIYPQGSCEAGFVLINDPLTYTIRFQNTGNSDAINIYVLDTLDANLDPESYRTIASSHNMITEILPGNILKFNFNNIQLPDSNSNESQSHGFVIFEIMADSMVSNGSTIENTANIFFDFNPAVVTNTLTNTLVNSIPHSFSSINQVVCDTAITINGTSYNSSGTYVQYMDNYLNCDSIITLNITLNQPTISTITQTGCDQLIINSQTYTTSGVYTQTLSNAVGCDSIITLNLTINTIDDLVTNHDTILVANLSGGTYQWLDCNTLLPISGANNQSFHITVNGSYAVIITDNGCSDTSDCFIIDDLSVLNTQPFETTIYPNPTTRYITVQTSTVNDILYIEILNSMGQVVNSVIYKNTQQAIIETLGPKGVYFIRISDSQGRTVVKKIIKDYATQSNKYSSL